VSLSIVSHLLSDILLLLSSLALFSHCLLLSLIAKPEYRRIRPLNLGFPKPDYSHRSRLRPGVPTHPTSPNSNSAPVKNSLQPYGITLNLTHCVTSSQTADLAYVRQCKACVAHISSHLACLESA